MFGPKSWCTKKPFSYRVVHHMLIYFLRAKWFFSLILENEYFNNQFNEKKEKRIEM